MITPTVGRVVWFCPYLDELLACQPGEPLAAIVTCVWSDTCVNLAVFDASGISHAYTSVLLVQPGEKKPIGGYCEWMPYQVGQAERTREAEAKPNRPPDPPGPFSEVG